MEVDGHAMSCGIDLAQHSAAEMLRFQGAGRVSPDLELAARLLAWWQTRPDPRCHLATVYQRGLNAISDAAARDALSAYLRNTVGSQRCRPALSSRERDEKRLGSWCRERAEFRPVGNHRR